MVVVVVEVVVVVVVVGHAVAPLVETLHCSIPDGVTGIFH
jgi:hypothetical protein